MKILKTTAIQIFVSRYSVTNQTNVATDSTRQRQTEKTTATWKNKTNLSDCCVGLQTSATLEVFLPLGEDSGISCGLF